MAIKYNLNQVIQQILEGPTEDDGDSEVEFEGYVDNYEMDRMMGNEGNEDSDDSHEEDQELYGQVRVDKDDEEHDVHNSVSGTTAKIRHLLDLLVV